MQTQPPATRRWMALGSLATIVFVIVFASFAVLSGLYNLAASVPHLYLSEQLIELALHRSVDTQSADVTVPDLDEPGLIRVGAAHYAAGCEPCHAAPGRVQNVVINGMYPDPPILADDLGNWETKELFWIVRHGLKYTGMPQWAGKGRGDEVWAVIAYVLQMPDQTPAEYASLTEGVAQFGEPRNGKVELSACSVCHGDASKGPAHDLVPALNGQSAPYLQRALDEYSSGRRESGMMEPISAGLSSADRQRLAEAYAALPPVKPQRTPAESDTTANGAEIAEKGIADRNVPPCLACHSRNASPQFPRLTGLSAGYIENQLSLFRRGVRGDTAHGSIMRRIAERIDDNQARQVAEYFAATSEAEALHTVLEVRPRQ